MANGRRLMANGWAAAMAMAAATTIGCAGGGSGSSGGTTATSPSSPPPNPTATNAITITTTGVTPKNIIVARGSQVTMTNNDVTSHDMQSDPHPEHTDCPELGSIGFLSPGQTHQSGNLNTPRTCGYHDHDDPERAALQGTITIQ